MKIPKQILAFSILTASLLSFLAGYILIQSGLKSNGGNSQQGSILDRFQNIAGATGQTIIPQGLFQLAEKETISPVSDIASESVLYYQADTGIATKADILTRQNTNISTAILPQLSRVIWSPDRRQVITVFTTATATEFKYYSYATGRAFSMGTNILDAVFSPDSTSVAAVRKVNDETIITTGAPGDQYVRTILKTRLERFSIAWPNPDTLALTVPNSDGTNDFYLLATNGDLTKVLEGQTALNVVWIPDGSGFMYSIEKDGYPVLARYNLASKNRIDLPLSVAADFCAPTLNGSAAFCLVDTKGETAVTRLDLTTGALQTISSNVIISGERVFLSHLQDFLIIINKSDHSLYAIRVSGE
ncbi:MAG TPA: hypothetical protein VG941_01750 [Candidatus Paceibacterota bacterium]|nr:hypothetical protein [Candidatus Paceibacterota bacterium]